jgi:hypothetical protein
MGLELLSETQFKTLKWSLTCSAILSVLGSLIIMWHASNKLKRPYHRILFMLSFTDLVSSVVVAVLTPARDTVLKPCLVCTLDGFVAVSMVYGSAFYNASLSVFFLVTIKYSYSDWKITRRVEPFLRGISLGYPMTLAIIGAGLQMYNPLNATLSCWINAYPENCEWDDTIECQRGEGAFLFALFAAAIPLAIIWTTLFWNNTAMYCFVRGLEKRSRQYGMRGAIPSTVVIGRSANTQPPGRVVMADVGVDNEVGTAGADNNAAGVDGVDSQAKATSIPSRQSTEAVRVMSRRATPANPDTSPNKTQQIMIQSLLYVLAFFMVFIFSGIVFVLSSTDPEGLESGKYFPIQVAESVLYPLQGFFDSFIYLRPRYVRFRKYFPDRSSWFAIRKAAFTRTSPGEAAAS